MRPALDRFDTATRDGVPEGRGTAPGAPRERRYFCTAMRISTSGDAAMSPLNTCVAGPAIW